SGGFPSHSGSKGLDLLEPTEHGTINWSKWTIEATGIGTLPEKRPENAPKASLESAKQEAYKKILKTIFQLRIYNSTTVSKLIDKENILVNKIESLIKDAQIIKQEYLADGTAKITMEFNLLGAFHQLILPGDIKQIESVKPITPPDSKPPIFSGLVVDAVGIRAKPAMVPKIVDENGEEVFGSAFVNRESAVELGVCGYFQDLSFARKQIRVADNPLLVKGLQTMAGAESIIVISNADAAKLKSASEHLQLLRKSRVLIVIDLPSK
ncbi:MAG: hypothetical protein AB1659_12010, partial [Thermodesulfobacteriota bacterium]